MQGKEFAEENFGEERTRRSTREAHVHVGGWRVLGCQGDRTEHDGKSKRCLADQEVPRERWGWRDGSDGRGCASDRFEAPV